MDVIGDERVDTSSVVIAGVAEWESGRRTERITAEVERLGVISVQVSNAVFVGQHGGVVTKGLPVETLNREVGRDSKALTRRF